MQNREEEREGRVLMWQSTACAGWLFTRGVLANVWELGSKVWAGVMYERAKTMFRKRVLFVFVCEVRTWSSRIFDREVELCSMG